MKIRLLMLALLAATVTGFGLVSLPVEAASSSVPCHECPDVYDTCSADADDDYAACVAGGQHTVAFCQAQLQDDLDACDLAESACYSTCFECEFEGEDG